MTPYCKWFCIAKRYPSMYCRCMFIIGPYPTREKVKQSTTTSVVLNTYTIICRKAWFHNNNSCSEPVHIIHDDKPQTSEMKSQIQLLQFLCFKDPTCIHSRITYLTVWSCFFLPKIVWYVLSIFAQIADMQDGLWLMRSIVDKCLSGTL